MRRFIVALLATSALTVSAFAADMPVKAPVYRAAPVPMYNWTGFYVGGDVGGGWGDHDRNLVPNTFANSYHSSGFIGGAHAGYNWQIDTFVLGIETDFNGTTIKGDDGGAGGTLDQTKVKWLGSTRGRLGYAWDRFLVFATGGLAYAELEHFNDGGASQTFSKTQTGWTVGGGLEYAIDNNWSVRAEYRYYDLGTYQNLAPSNGITAYEVKTKLNTVTAGFSYKF
jgi:outer membrane immunogenic protein